MFSALSSLIWGSEQEVPVTETKNIDEHVEVENEWIYIQPKGKNIDQIESLAFLYKSCVFWITFSIKIVNVLL